MRQVLYNLTCYKLTILNHLQSLFSRNQELKVNTVSVHSSLYSFSQKGFGFINGFSLSIIRKSVFYLGLKSNWHEANSSNNINLYASGLNKSSLTLGFFPSLLQISRLIKRKTICCILLLTSTVHLRINYPSHYIFLFSTPFSIFLTPTQRAMSCFHD